MTKLKGRKIKEESFAVIIAKSRVNKKGSLFKHNTEHILYNRQQCRSTCRVQSVDLHRLILVADAVH
jgi:hypothetical protein